MSETTLTAAPRTEFGKGAARRIRRAGNIPAVLYGHGIEPVHITLPGHEVFLAIKGQANPLVRLDVNGRSELALVKDVQRDPIKPIFIEHLDLVLVRKGEKVHVEIPVHVVGEPETGTVAAQDMQTIKIVADATRIPAGVEVSVDGVGEGTVIRVSEITLPAGTELESDPEGVIVSVHVPAAEPEPEVEEAEEGLVLAAAEAGETAEAEEGEEPKAGKGEESAEA